MAHPCKRGNATETMAQTCRTSNGRWSPAGYFFDTPDGWGSYNLWNREGKPDGVGYYKVVKNCDDPENCFLQFYCIDDNGDLYHDC